MLLWLMITRISTVAAGSAPPSDRPNVLLLLTDDQDIMLGSFDHMPHVKSLIQEQGMTFVNGFVHTPICCPSRSSILSGRYLHNCRVRNNSISGNCYGTDWRNSIEKESTFAIHAQAAGYTTAYTGKYLNQYGYGYGYNRHGQRANAENVTATNDFNNDVDADDTAVPPGWDHWLGLVGNSVYYNYTLIKRGNTQSMDTKDTTGNSKAAERIHHSDKYPEDYLPSVMNEQVLQWMDELPEPWLIVAAWPTPHGPFTPAPWAVGTMSDYHAPLTENYNASQEYMQQKHWLLRQLHPLSEHTAEMVDKYYQMRLEALKSIDLHVAEMVQKLQNASTTRIPHAGSTTSSMASSQLDHTVILFTSDNGFQFGQHRLAMDKRHLYENDIRVPFCIRGPKILPNTTSTRIVANIDIAPTILDIVRHNDTEQAATINKAQNDMDGESFWSHVQGIVVENEDREKGLTDLGRVDLLISYNGEGMDPCGLAECPTPWDAVIWMPDSYNNTYHCVRTMIPSTTSTVSKFTSTKSLAVDSIYCRFEDNEDFVEYYDLRDNPFQLNNDYSKLDPVQRQRYEERLQELMHCQGPSCRRLPQTPLWPALDS